MIAGKVVHITSVHIWSDTRIFQRMCQGLARRNWQVTLVAPNVPDQTADGVEVRGVNVPSSRLLRAILGGYRTIRAARAIDADIYHIHDPELLIWKWLLQQGRRRVVYDMHEYVPGAITTRRWIPNLLRRSLAAAWTCFEKLTLRQSPVVLAEDSYVTHYKWVRKKAVVLNLPDTKALLAIAERPRTSSMVYVGRVSKARGSLLMLQALALLLERGLRVQLDVIGPIATTHQREIENAIRELKLGGSVHLHGYMKSVQAWEKAKGSLAGLAVLAPEPNYIGSFPTKMFEYMALGVPVVVSDFPLYRQVVEGNQCGLCVDPLNPKALADAVEHLVRDPELVRTLGDHGRAAVQARYRWDHQLDALESFYRDILQPSTQTPVLQ